MTKTGFFKTVKAFSCAAARTAIFAAALAAGLFASAALSSCSNLEGDDFSPATQTAPAGTAPGGENIPASLKMGSVSGTIQQKEEQPTVARSVVPTVADVTGGIISYTVSAWGTKADGTVVPETSPITVDTTTTTFSLGLEYGTWTLRADAKDTSSNIIMTQTAATPITLDDLNPVVNLNFALDYAQISGTPGALSLTMAYATSVSKISYSLLKSDGTAVASGVVNPAPASSFTLNASQDSALGSLEPGDYQLVVEFLATDSSVLMRMDQAVQIYSNITTNKIDGVAPYINSGAVNVSADVIKKYQQSVVYVGGTGIGSGTAASDSNNGTQFDPVEHIERALEIIEASMLTSSDVPDGFKVFVQADTSLTGNLALSSSKKISIVGTNTSAYYKIDGALTNGITASASDISFSYINLNKVKGFKVTAGQTNLTNCKITNGVKPAASDGGAGLCVDVGGAKAVLTNCQISGCVSDGFGGAIHVAADSGSGTAQVDLLNCVIGQESTSCATDSAYSNYAESGGGGINIGSGGKAVLNNTKVFYNSTKNGTGAGGGIRCFSGTLQITGGQINHNFAGYGGGGIAVFGISPSLTIDDCVVGESSAIAAATGIGDCGNYTAGEGGGGISIAAGTFSTTSGFSVIKNYAAGTSLGGGGIYITAPLTLDKCDILYNASANKGGGVYNEKTISLQGGTIAGNAAAGDGGGVYVSAGAKLFMSGSAVIGDKDADSHADEHHYSNKAANGGAIAIDNGEAYIGYTSATAKDDSFEGGIYYNYASSSGGGVNMSDNSANKLYCYKGTIEKNYAPLFGGAMAVGDAGEVQINKTAFTQNLVGYYGGAISIGNTNASTITVALVDATFEKNCIYDYELGYGGAIYAQYYDSLTVSGSTYIPAGDASGATGAGKNDVWLASGKTITIGSTLDAATTPVATITPATYAPGTAVLSDTGTGASAGALVQSELSKIAVTPQSADDEWTIGYDSSTKKGVLATANIYVSGGSDGNDTTGTGSSAAPYKTVAFALTKVMAPNCSIIIKESTTESEALNVTAAMTGLTIKSADTAQKTIKGLVTKQIDINSAATISNIVFDAWMGVNVDDDVDTVELNDVAIKNSFNAIAGGGLYLDNNAKVRASNLEVSDCYVTGGSGGGIYIGSGAKLDADGLVVAGCHVDGTSNDGGGIYNVGTLIAKNARISGCVATRHGAGIFNDNGATLVLDNDCDIPSGIYLTGGSGTGVTAAKPIYVKAYFGLASGAPKIPVTVEERSGADKQFNEGDAVVQGWDTYDVKEAQVNCFATSGTGLSLEYDGAATPPCGKLVDKSIAGGIKINVGGNISFEVATPTASGEKARFNVIDNSSGTPTYVTPTSAQIKILQYGSAVYSAAAQEVAATFLTEGEYELYCKAVVGGVTYDTTIPFGAGGKYIPLTLEAATAGAVVTFDNKASGPVTYRVNGGTLETIASGASEDITLDNIGDKVQFFGDNTAYGVSNSANCSKISCSKDCYVYGNVMSLVKSDGFASEDTLTGSYNFAYLFYENTKIKNKTGYDLLLPATTLTADCYYSMFCECSSLTTAPALPATNLATECYSYMFYGCSSLTAAPVLPAETLATECYRHMFCDCSSLTTAPALPAATLASSCYRAMFCNCTSLVTAPALPATTLKTYCYKNMFNGCTSLATAPALPATTLANECYYAMFYDCASLATAPALPATTLAEGCYEGMFLGCASLTAAPELSAMTLATQCYQQMFDECTSLATAPTLPATTLATWCYYGMFRNCKELTTAPELPATILKYTCYQQMFKGCTKLNSVTCLAIDISAENCTADWLSGVAATGTFTKAAGMTGWTIDSTSGIPTGWTVKSGGAAIPADFKKITAGSFKRAESSGATAYNVTISKDFYMCEHEVTQKEWFDLMGKTQAELISAASGSDKGTGDNYPVYYVNWYHAIAYCNKRSAAEGLTPCYTVSSVSDWGTLDFASIPTSDDSTWNAVSYDPDADGYRLPTEAEWEYAALGTYKDNANWNGYGDSSNSTVKVFAGYNGSNSIDDYAWYTGTATDSKTHEVKGKTANSNDLYDMSGNVFEWCWDRAGNYDSADVTDPIGASGSFRINRGGSWSSSAVGCSVTNRDNNAPFGRNYGIGFRVVRNAP